jgi:hypothetical protein
MLKKVSLLFQHLETQNVKPFSRDKRGNRALAQSTEKNYHQGKCSGKSLSCCAWDAKHKTESILRLSERDENVEL